MSNINNIQNNIFQQSTETTAKEKNKAILGQEDFLKLLVTQMSFQNPLEPEDPGDFLGQMAQFGTVDGITQLNQSIANLSNGLQSNQALHASSMVGRRVNVPSDFAMLTQEHGLQGFVEVPYAVNNLKVNIVSETGEVVKQLNLGYQEDGTAAFGWNGINEKGEALPQGKYRIVAEGEMNGKPFALSTLASANVDSVTLGKGFGNIILNLNGLGNINLSDIKEIA